jgi:hypothetical protein
MQGLQAGAHVRVSPNHSQPDNRRNQVVSTTLSQAFYPLESLGTFLDAYGTFRLTQEFDPGIVQPVTIRNTDYAISVAICTTTFIFLI